MAVKKLENLWTFSELQEYLQIPRSTIYQYISTGKIPSVMIGRHRRFIPAEIEKAVRSLPK